MVLKKQWYEVISPKMFGEKVIGETLAVDSKQLINRTIEVNLMSLIRDYSKFYIKIYLQVERVENNKAYTKFIGHEVVRERIYRMIQRRLRRVDSITDAETKDGKKIRLKLVFSLLKRVNNSIKTAARKKAKECVEKAVKDNDLEGLVKMITAGSLQEELRKEVKKIYPVGNLEIRKSEVLN